MLELLEKPDIKGPVGPEHADAFADAFGGFPYAYGASGDRPHCVWQEVTWSLFDAHLAGVTPIGIYPMVYDPWHHVGGPEAFDDNRRYQRSRDRDLWRCKWGVVDIDASTDARTGQGTQAEVLDAGFAIQAELGTGAWVERTRSGGIHVWLFVDDWVRCDDMRGFLANAVHHSGADIDGIFPRADECSGPPGNFVRLPYFGNAPHGRQTMVDGWGEPIPLAVFLEELTAE